MKRFLIGLLFLAAFGMALAQPVDYQLWCEGEVIGVVSITEDNVHVAVLAGVICEGEVVVEPEGAPFDVAFTEGGILLIYEDTSELLLTPEDYSAVAPEALAGMLLAQELRTMAMERREFGQAQAEERGAEMRPDLPEDEIDEEELEEEAVDNGGPPDWVTLPDAAREAPRP